MVTLLSSDRRPAVSAQGVEFVRTSSEDLANGDFMLEYLVEDLIVRGQPGGIFGGKKSLKTTLAIYMALSMSIARDLFGRFRVPQPVRVGVMSGESGAATIQETARRQAKSMGRTLADFGNVVWCFDLPQLGNAEHLEALEQFITGNELEALVIDPTYLCMPVGDSASNLFVVGGLLKGLTAVGQRTGCTLLICHHTTKGKVDPYSPPELEDIAWAGFQEWVRQWILVGRRKGYDPENGGHHELWLNVGGSAGHSSLWALDVDEGVRSDPGGRRWEAEIKRASQARADAAEDKARERREKADQKRHASRAADRDAVEKALRAYPDGETKTTLREAAGMNGKRFGPVFAELLRENRVVECGEIRKTNGQSYPAYKPTGTTGTHRDRPGES